jgi:hypothetical protein
LTGCAAEPPKTFAFVVKFYADIAKSQFADRQQLAQKRSESFGFLPGSPVSPEVRQRPVVAPRGPTDSSCTSRRCNALQPTAFAPAPTAAPKKPKKPATGAQRQPRQPHLSRPDTCTCRKSDTSLAPPPAATASCGRGLGDLARGVARLRR